MSKIAVLGTGDVGDTIGSKLIELGHTVIMGSRTASNEKTLLFIAKHGGKATAGTYAYAAAKGEIIFNCTRGLFSVEALKMAGEENLKDKIIVDVSNPIDLSKGYPPILSICNTSSVGEEIQNAFPSAKVVKALNTVWCGLMVNPGLVNNGDHTTFICGNDINAKQRVIEILESFGWDDENILDLGNITASRGTEMYLALWLRVMGKMNKSTFNIKIVR